MSAAAASPVSPVSPASPASWSMCSHEGDPRRSARRLQKFAGGVLRSPDARSRAPGSVLGSQTSSARKALFPERSSPRTPEGAGAGPDAERSPPRKPRPRRREFPRSGDSSPPTPVPEKRARAGDEETPKAKVALFGSPRALPTGAFYGAPAPALPVAALPVPASSLRPPATRETSRRRRERPRCRRGPVGHGVRRPKASSTSRAKEAALREAVRLLEDSPLNDYIADFFKSAPAPASAPARASESKEIAPPIDEFCDAAADDGDERSAVQRLLDEWPDEDRELPPLGRLVGVAAELREASARNGTRDADPQKLLSPTTEMCCMTSDLFLNSPGASAARRRVPESSSAAQKLFPVFDSDGGVSFRGELSVRRDRDLVSVLSDKLKTGAGKRTFADTQDQYLIDAGQKKLGPTECEECGVVYRPGDAADEADHSTYHSAGDVLKFAGWKAERFCGRWGEGRTLAVHPGDPTAHWRRVRDLLDRVVHPQLGYAAALKENAPYKAYLYVEKKLIVGCLVAEKLSRANRAVTHNGVECCSERSYPVECGVSRLWTHRAHRNRGVATKLMNSMRANFLFGRVLTVEEIAFSSPTPTGRAFAEKYTADPNFYTYML